MIEPQTTFIPKKFGEPKRKKQIKKHTVDPISLAAWVIFLSSVLAIGGLYFYRAYLENTIASKVGDIRRAIDAVDPNLVAELRRAEEQLVLAKLLVDNHTAASPVFDFLERETVKTLRFSSFTYALEGKEAVELLLPGEARTYNAIALEGEIFDGEADIASSRFTNFTLSDTGTVLFDFGADAKRAFVLYRENLDAASFKERFSAAASAAPVFDESLPEEEAVEEEVEEVEEDL